MPASLDIARSFAENIRFSGEPENRSPQEGREDASVQLGNIFSQHNLQISPAVTPSLASSLEQVFERLHIPSECVTAYVVPDPVIQATCFASSTTDCVLSFTSGLVQLLDEPEFQFVAGHEIGHFLLSHGLVHQPEGPESLESLMEQRAREISADRIGFVACKSLSCAIQSMMKTASGLPTDKLRFDVDSFLSQLREPSNATFSVTQASTHPSILVRCRAVLWFSMSDYSLEHLNQESLDRIRKLDSQIERDLQRYVDRPARDKIEKAKRNYALWRMVEQAFQDGEFDKKEQEVIASDFGRDALGKLIGLIDGLNKTEVEEVVRAKLSEAIGELHAILPESADREIQTIGHSVLQKLTRRQ
tara:strand:- start:956 stop:2038 length:1083 start_codon:yes stop_codon:yes gene_type:complete